MSVFVLWRWGELLTEDDNILVFSTREKAIEYCTKAGWSIGTINNFCDIEELSVK